jgi:hypothetical protein
MVETQPSGGSYATRANNFTYNAAGAVSSMQLGNGRWESTQFNSRLQPTQIALGTTQNGTDQLTLNYDYGTTANNGNVQSQTITVPTVGTNPGFTATQVYTYDPLNRLKSATETVDSGTQGMMAQQQSKTASKPMRPLSCDPDYDPNCGGPLNDPPEPDPAGP